MSEVRRRIFPEAFKREAVERVRSGGLSAGKVAAELGIHERVYPTLDQAVFGGIGVCFIASPNGAGGDAVVGRSAC